MDGQAYCSFGIRTGGCGGGISTGGCHSGGGVMSHRNDTRSPVPSPSSLMGDGGVTVKKESIDVLFDPAPGGGEVSADGGGLMSQLLPVSLPKAIARRRPYLRTARSSAETCVCEVN